MLQVAPLSHRHRGGQRYGAESSSDLQQLGGIVAGPLAGQDDAIVAGQLAFDAQPPQRVPGERMEPIERAR